MKRIFINLKRFDVPKKMGGICPDDNPGLWIKHVMEKTAEFGLGNIEGMEITYLLPESLILKAIDACAGIGRDKCGNINIGCQGVFKDDVKKGGNFGAFTTFRPASSMVGIGCTWAVIGHSEERRWYQEIITDYEPDIVKDINRSKKAKETVNGIINKEVLCAFSRGLNVLLCVGETAEERGEGNIDEQYENVRSIIGNQLEKSLNGVNDFIGNAKLAIGYEPIWAIGPGKTPPNSEYISFISSFIKNHVKAKFGFIPDVVYGGGLKEENVGSISRIPAIDGGLVALTRFTGDIAFEPEGLKNIILNYNL